MRLRTTLILLFVVAALGVFIFAWERHQRTTIEKREAANLTGLEESSIETMEIRNASGISKFKKRPNGQWMLTEPIDDRVDPDFMKRMLALAVKAEVTVTLDDEEVKKSELKSYGLDDKTAIQVAWKVGGKTMKRLKIGKIGALGDTVYAQAPGNDDFPKIYLIDARPEAKMVNLREELSRPIAEMRDTLLLPYRANQVVSFSIRRPGTTGEISVMRQLVSDKEATPWTLVKPLKTRGEQGQIDDLVGLFTTARVNKLLPVGPAPSGLPATPAVEIQFQDTYEGKGSTVRFFPPETPDAKTITGFLTDRKAWFTIDAEFLLAIPESPNDLRSHTLIDLELKKITTLLIETTDGEPVSLYRVNGRWVMKKSEKEFLRASGDRVAKTIQALNQAEIGKFVTDSMTNPADYGLDKPFQTVTFGTVVHKNGIGALTPDNSLVLQFGFDKDKRLYANIKGENSVYLMLPDHIGIVASQPIKWRDQQLLEFIRPSVRRLSQTIGTEPPVVLVSPPRSTEGWTGTRAGNDVTSLIAAENVERLLARLGTLNVAEWSSGLQEGHQALQSPSLTLEVDVEYLDDGAALGETKKKRIQVTFAPSGDPKQALFFIGRCSEIADYFLISRDVYRELATPLLANPK